MINQKMLTLGTNRSIIREIFEYSRVRSAQIGAENVFDFSLGNPSVPPPTQVREAILALIEGNSVDLHAYTSAQGDFSVRSAIADKISKSHGVKITPELIYTTCGAAASLAITLKALCNEGDEVIVFAPYFTEYRVFIENAGAVVVESQPAPDFQIDLADLESKITEKTKAIIVNSPNNPSGVVYDEGVIKATTDLLKKKEAETGKQIYLIADEPYRELVYDGVKVPYLMNYYDDVIVCYSFSKSLSLPGERIGYIAVCPAMRNATEVYSAVCGAGRSLGYVCAPSLFQKVIKNCIDVKVNVDAYKANRDILYGALTEMGYECVKPSGAFYMFLKAPHGNAYEFYEKAKEKEILVVPCDDFGVSGYVRIAYCVDEQRIIKSLPAFKALAEEIFGK